MDKGGTVNSVNRTMTPLPDEMRIYQAKQSSVETTALLGYFEMVSWSKGAYSSLAAALTPKTIRIPSFSTDGPGKEVYS